jgi:ATP-dependent DNA helicase RecQ
LEPLLTTLLRSYGGIFDFPCFVSEKLLARLHHTTEEAIRLSLQKISAHGVISYTLQNDQPQIMFLKQRVPADEFSINFEKYNRRKESFIRRVQNMIAYTEITGCRSKFINKYFGDTNAKPCGICDNCLNAAPKELSAAEFRKFSSLIFESLQTRSRSTEELLAELKELKKEKAWKILEFLQAEDKIEFDQKGLIKLK